MLPMKQVLSKDGKRTCTRCADRDAVIDARPQTGAGLVPDGDVKTTVNVVTERVVTDGCVTDARCVVLHGKVAERIIFAVCIVCERVRPWALLKEAIDIVIRAQSAEGIVLVPSSLLTSAVSSNGSVLCAGGVQQQRYGANCGIGIRVVGGQRSSAYTRVKAAVDVVEERPPTNACISRHPVDKVLKCIAPFRCR